MLSPDILEQIIVKYEREQNFTRMVYRIIRSWGTPLDIHSLTYWVIVCFSMSSFCDSQGDHMAIANELAAKGFHLANISKILTDNGAIRIFTREGKLFFVRQK